MALTTPLYEEHVKLNAKIVDFHGWLLPLQYGSQIDEHHYVRKDCGMFDVSHMNIVDVTGEGAKAYLSYLLANNVDKLVIGKALYTAMLNESGGIIDDLIVYKYAEDFFRLVLNSATKEKDLAWLKQHASSFEVTITVREELANIAIQGPMAREKLTQLYPQLAQALYALKPFCFLLHENWQFATTGYTGEDGFEVILPAEEARAFWCQLLEIGVKPCGLGARDTLRLEAGLNLYGSDMDETVTPLESNIAWTVAWEPAEREFIGRKALEAQKARNDFRRLVGVVLEERGVPRAEQKVFQHNEEIGVIVSGTFSPTMQQGIAFARVKQTVETGCFIDVRGKMLPATLIKLPFVRLGKVLVKKEEKVT